MYMFKRQALTFYGEVGRCSGRSQKPIGGHAGVVPRILWEEPGDEEGAVHHDLHTGLERSDRTTKQKNRHSSVKTGR